MAFVISSKAHARLISVDASDALQMPGVVDFISHKDVPGENCFGFGAQDQQVFAVDKVCSVIWSGYLIMCPNIMWIRIYRGQSWTPVHTGCMYFIQFNI